MYTEINGNRVKHGQLNSKFGNRKINGDLVVGVLYLSINILVIKYCVGPELNLVGDKWNQ